MNRCAICVGPLPREMVICPGCAKPIARLWLLPRLAADVVRFRPK